MALYISSVRSAILLMVEWPGNGNNDTGHKLLTSVCKWTTMAHFHEFGNNPLMSEQLNI